MVRKIILAVGLGFMATAFSQIPIMRATDRMAISHDGNNWDKDEAYAYAMDYAVMWAHGMQKQLVHEQINTLLSRDTKLEFYDAMMESGKGRALFPGFDTTIQQDCHPDDGKTAVAHFSKVAGESSDQSLLFFIVCGPMEVPWQSINATAQAKRKYIRVFSHSDWNEDHTGGGGLLKHTFKNMMTDFSQDGVQFYSSSGRGYTAPFSIPDQSSSIGGVGSVKWDFLSEMTGSTIAPSTWTWLRGRDFKLNGDCSDISLVWLALTGNHNPQPSDLETRFKNPLPMVAPFPPTTAINSKPRDSQSNGASFNINAEKIGSILKISSPNMAGSGSVVVYDLLSKVVAKGRLESGVAKLSASTTLSGTYFVKVSFSQFEISQAISIE